MTEPAWKNTFFVGERKCELTFSQSGGLNAVWAPDVPPKLSERDWIEYRRGRDTMLEEVRKHLGCKTTVIEIHD
jgi:hypothetical protein